MLRIYHEAQPYGVCGQCRARFLPDKSSNVPADVQIRQQFAEHTCREENLDKVWSPRPRKET